MGNCFLYGNGGSSPLNFKVVGGTSAPSSPNENTIWINTSTAITDYVFSREQPSGVDGRVWIKTGLQSSVAFNGLKKNTVNLYPVTAKQYVSGAWVNMTAKSYQDGTWTDWWYGQLYDTGEEFEAFTGGWITESKGAHQTDANYSGTPAITRGDTSVRLQMEDSGGAMFYTANKIDLSEFSTLKFHGTVSGTSSLWKMAAWTDIPQYYYNNMAASVTLTAVENGYITLDVSGLTGAYYIGFGIYGSSVYADMTSLILE